MNDVPAPPSPGVLRSLNACALCALRGADPQRRLFTGLLLGAALVPAATAQPAECRRSRAAGLIPADQVEAAAQQQYAALLQQARGDRALGSASDVQLQRLRYIAQRMLPFTQECNPRARQWRWEVNLIASPQINAFCMPGGKIAFYTGILAQLQLDDNEVGMIMGHEIAHALLEHARERMAKSGGLQLLLRGGASLLGLGGLGDLAAQGLSQLGSLTFSRGDETEADALGLVIATRAGYDPRAGVSLWQKMGAATAGRAPPQWLSTHPAGDTRIREIQARLPGLLPAYQAAPRPERRFPVARRA